MVVLKEAAAVQQPEKKPEKKNKKKNDISFTSAREKCTRRTGCRGGDKHGQPCVLASLRSPEWKGW